MKNLNERKYEAILGIIVLNAVISYAGFLAINANFNEVNSNIEAVKTDINSVMLNQAVEYDKIQNLEDNLLTNHINELELENSNKTYDGVNLYSYSEVDKLIAESHNSQPDDNYFNLPDYDTSFKAYMDYRTITDNTSVQYKIQQSAWTDNDGFRRVNNDYIVAMGTYYTSNCGERFKITFDDDNEITVMIGDIKANENTDYTNQYSPVYDNDGDFISANVIEFIVDVNEISKTSKLLGTMNEIEGNIKYVERIE